MTSHRPRLWILSGPSGAGKGTICARLRQLHPEVHIPISATTRAPRPGEIDAVSYHFITPERFDAMIAEGALLEHAKVHGSACYGTPRADVYAALAAGKAVLLEIDLQGARQVKQNLPDAQLVFLTAPSWEELERRLRGRGTEANEAVTRRLETARAELAAQDEADFVIVNDDVERATRTLVRLMGL